MRSAPTQAKSARSAFGLIREKIAVLALGLLTLPGCKVCLSFNTNTAEGKTEIAKEAARRLAVDESGTRIIHIPEASASVIMDRSDVEGYRSKITALLDISFISPMRQQNGSLPEYGLLEYELSEDNHPWTKLFVGPDGNIGMELDGGVLALEFTCDANPGKDKNIYCTGKEADPEELDKKIAAAVKKAGEAKKAEEKRMAEADAKKERKEDSKKHAAGNGKRADADADAKPSEPAQTDFPRAYLSSSAIDLLNNALVAKISDDFEYLKDLARRLSQGTKFREAVERKIQSIERHPWYGGEKAGVAKIMIIDPIKILLNENPEMIQTVAKELGVQLDKDKKDTGTDGGDKPASN
ncbi:MAG: hypothetical protein ABIG80_02945 [Patescibacteria group bacterium]